MDHESTLLMKDSTLPQNDLLDAGASRVSTSRRCNYCRQSIKDVHWEECNRCGIFDLHDPVKGIQDGCPMPKDAVCTVMGVDGKHELLQVTYDQYDPKQRNEVWQANYNLIKTSDGRIANDYDLYLATQGLQRDRNVSGPEIDMVALKVLDYVTSPKSSKILCLDGGGVRGYFTVRVLQCLIEKLYPNNVGTVSPNGFVSADHRQWEFVKHFDVIGGTSTGGFIAFCLAVGYSLEELKKVYTNFSYYFSRHLVSKITRVPIFSAKYDPTNIDNKIREIVNNAWEHYGLGGENTTLGALANLQKRLKEAPLSFNLPSLVINAYNVTTNDIMIFQSDNKEHAGYDIVDVLRATKAAPTYFPPVNVACPAVVPNEPKVVHSFVDGGMFANDPALATVFARSLQTGNQTYEIVSIGTTTFPTKVRLSPSGGYLSWIFPNPVEQIKNLWRDKNAVTDSSGLLIETFMQANASLTESFMSDLDPRKVRRFKFNYALSSAMQLDDPTFTASIDKNFTETSGFLNIPDSVDMKALVAFVRRHITDEADDEVFRRVLKKDPVFSQRLEAHISDKIREFGGAGAARQ